MCETSGAELSGSVHVVPQGQSEKWKVQSIEPDASTIKLGLSLPIWINDSISQTSYTCWHADNKPSH